MGNHQIIPPGEEPPSAAQRAAARGAGRGPVAAEAAAAARPLGSTPCKSKSPSPATRRCRRRAVLRPRPRRQAGDFAGLVQGLSGAVADCAAAFMDVAHLLPPPRRRREGDSSESDSASPVQRRDSSSGTEADRERRRGPAGRGLSSGVHFQPHPGRQARSPVVQFRTGSHTHAHPRRPAQASPACRSPSMSSPQPRPRAAQRPPPPRSPATRSAAAATGSCPSPTRSPAAGPSPPRCRGACARAPPSRRPQTQLARLAGVKVAPVSPPAAVRKGRTNGAGKPLSPLPRSPASQSPLPKHASPPRGVPRGARPRGAPGAQQRKGPQRHRRFHIAEPVPDRRPAGAIAADFWKKAGINQPSASDVVRHGGRLSYRPEQMLCLPRASTPDGDRAWIRTPGGAKMPKDQPLAAKLPQMDERAPGFHVGCRVTLTHEAIDDMGPDYDWSTDPLRPQRRDDAKRWVADVGVVTIDPDSDSWLHQDAEGTRVYVRGPRGDGDLYHISDLQFCVGKIDSDAPDENSPTAVAARERELARERARQRAAAGENKLEKLSPGARARNNGLAKLLCNSAVALSSQAATMGDWGDSVLRPGEIGIACMKTDVTPPEWKRDDPDTGAVCLHLRGPRGGSGWVDVGFLRLVARATNGGLQGVSRVHIAAAKAATQAAGEARPPDSLTALLITASRGRPLFVAALRSLAKQRAADWAASEVLSVHPARDPLAEWKADELAQRCENSECNAPFTLLRRKSHCRYCGGIFCWGCVTNRWPLRSAEDGVVEHRKVCEPCWNKLLETQPPFVPPDQITLDELEAFSMPLGGRGRLRRCRHCQQRFTKRRRQYECAKCTAPVCLKCSEVVPAVGPAECRATSLSPVQPISPLSLDVMGAKFPGSPLLPNGPAPPHSPDSVDSEQGPFTGFLAAPPSPGADGDSPSPLAAADSSYARRRSPRRGASTAEGSPRGSASPVLEVTGASFALTVPCDTPLMRPHTPDLDPEAEEEPGAPPPAPAGAPFQLFTLPLGSAPSLPTLATPSPSTPAMPAAATPPLAGCAPPLRPAGEGDGAEAAGPAEAPEEQGAGNSKDLPVLTLPGAAPSISPSPTPSSVPWIRRYAKKEGIKFAEGVEAQLKVPKRRRCQKGLPCRAPHDPPPPPVPVVVRSRFSQVTVAATRETAEGRTQFIIYFIYHSGADRVPHTVLRFYNDFVDLRHGCPKLQQLEAPFPTKTLGRCTGAALAERSNKLQVWLAEAASGKHNDPAAMAAVEGFLLGVVQRAEPAVVAPPRIDLPVDPSEVPVLHCCPVWVNVYRAPMVEWLGLYYFYSGVQIEIAEQGEPARALEFYFDKGGIHTCTPTMCGISNAELYKRFRMGTATKNRAERQQLILQLTRDAQWQQGTYNMFTHNSTDFARELCWQLGVDAPPDWLNSVPRLMTCLPRSVGDSYARSFGVQHAWQADDAVAECQCGMRYSWLSRRHHCRMCGNVFCDACTNSRILLPLHGDRRVRVCDTCCQKLQESPHPEMLPAPGGPGTPGGQTPR